MDIVSLSLSVQVSKFSFNSLVGKSCWPSNDTTSFSSGNNSGWQRIKLYIYKRRIVLLPLEEVKRKRNSVFITGGIPSSRRGGLAKRIGQAEYLSCLFMSGRRDGMAGGGRLRKTGRKGFGAAGSHTLRWQPLFRGKGKMERVGRVGGVGGESFERWLEI